MEQEDSSQDNEPCKKNEKKNKRPLNGPSAAKNRRVLNVDDESDDEADIFITSRPKKEEEQKAKIAISQPATSADRRRQRRSPTV